MSLFCHFKRLDLTRYLVVAAVVVVVVVVLWIRPSAVRRQEQGETPQVNSYLWIFVFICLFALWIFVFIIPTNAYHYISCDKRKEPLIDNNVWNIMF